VVSGELSITRVALLPFVLGLEAAADVAGWEPAGEDAGGAEVFELALEHAAIPVTRRPAAAMATSRLPLTVLLDNIDYPLGC
jgi:hypothetical protein